MEAEQEHEETHDGQDDVKNILSDLDLESEPELEPDPNQEEKLVQVMKWLEQEIASIDSPPSLQETEFVTINGDEETCGSSFSGTTSTVMASVDTRRVCVAPYLASTWPFALVDPSPITGETPVDGVDEWMMEFVIPDDLSEYEG